VKHHLVTTVLAIFASMTLAGSVATPRAPAAADRHSDTHVVAPHGNPHASEQSDADDQGENEPPDQNRPHNHGWYVSQAAHDKSTTGAAHGKAVSAVARGDDGKTDTADH